MLFQIWHKIKHTDWLIFSASLFLACIGLVLIYAISTNPVSPNPLIFSKQLAFVLIGLIVFLLLSNINYRVWMMYSKIIYIAFGLLLIFVLFFGVNIRGTTGWFALGPLTFQPVEFAKISLIIFLAKYFTDHSRHFFLWSHILISGAAMLIYVILVIQQPDLGSAMVMFGTWFLMLLVVGIPRKHVLILIGSFFIIAIVSWFFVLQPYQKDRLTVFFNPQVDTLGVGYNVRQSIIAVGSGRIFGRGFGLGPQSQLKFLPEPETDFIFAVLAEEYGLVGTLVLLTGIFFLLSRLLSLARKTADNFAAFFLLGLASLLMVQAFINIGMNIGIAPVTGIPLPFISAGGSSLTAFFIAFGIASSIVADQRTLSSDT